jgi:YbbR domain-containing protein
MRRLWGERQLYFLLSVAIAVAMWYVATAENPVSRSVKVDLETRNLYPTEIIVRPSPTATVKVTVRVQGPRSQIALLDPKLVEAFVDLSGLGPGEHPQVPVVVGVPVRDVQVVEQRPSSIFVVLDTFASKRLSVEVSLIGRPSEGVVVGNPHTTPTYVVVSGPASLVAQVRHALVSVDTATLRQSAVGSLPVIPADANGLAVAGVQVTPKIASTSIVVSEGVISKVVPIIPTVVGTPPQALAVTSAAADPGTVTLTGSPSVLRGIVNAPTTPVDASGARGDFSRRVALQLPPNVTSSVPQVTVTVHVGRGLLSTILRAVPVHVVGVPAGSATRVMPEAVDIQVEGPQDVVRRLTAQGVTVEVSAAGRQPGQYTMTPRAILPQGVHVLTIHPAQVVIFLSST